MQGNVREYKEMLENARKCKKMSENAKKCEKMQENTYVQGNIINCYKTLQTAREMLKR
jgi:uncharacterized protein YktA (UPF0223 family)